MRVFFYLGTPTYNKYIFVDTFNQLKLTLMGSRNTGLEVEINIYSASGLVNFNCIPTLN